MTNTIQSKPSGGRAMLSKVNYDLLSELASDRLELLELTTSKISDIWQRLKAFKGQIDGISESSIERISEYLGSGSIETVFVDGSNLGEVSRLVKTTAPKVRVVTFFHNVESRFFLGSMIQDKSIHSLGVLIANYLAERKAVKFSDRLICLNQRDSDLLKRVYGKGATDLMPMTLRDQYSGTGTEPKLAEKYCLFVGGAFYANLSGVQWYAHKVAPHINIKTLIVGRGFDSYREELNIEGKIQVIGEAHDLETWYAGAEFVVAPIFDGSGMKTKVAEALMFGKHVIGTAEAFIGYEDIASKVGWICNDAKTFVTQIGLAEHKGFEPFDPSVRKIFDENYSFESAKSRMAKIIN